jgi:hypothetical protein
MKRRDLIRHLENRAANFSAKAAITRFTSTVARRNRQQFLGIARSSISSRKEKSAEFVEKGAKLYAKT